MSKKSEPKKEFGIISSLIGYGFIIFLYTTFIYVIIVLILSISTGESFFHLKGDGSTENSRELSNILMIISFLISIPVSFIVYKISSWRDKRKKDK